MSDPGQGTGEAAAAAVAGAAEAPDGTRKAALRLQRFEELCGATLRALAGDASLQYRGRRLYRGDAPLPVRAPHLRLDDAEASASLGAQRALVDGAALRLLHSDAALHRSLAPADPVERLVFELLEQLRVETRAARWMHGQRRNLQARFIAWSDAFHHSGLTESSLGILLFTVSQVCWSRLTGLPLAEDISDLLEVTRARLVPVIGGALAGIRRHRDHQRAFAAHALEIARIVGALARAEQALLGGEDGREADASEEDATRARRRFALLLDVDDEEDAALPEAASGESRAFAANAGAYRVFTTRHDREVAAATLVRAARLREYREVLDERVHAQGVHVARLARQLRAVLARPERDGWNFGEDEGTLDGRRLAQLVSTPSERRVFRQERVQPHADCVVSFLIDCSGSMKAHMDTVAVLADVMARALDVAGVGCEVLGFTTGAWNGGRARNEWLARGRPAAPGRLNEVCHLVFKDADHGWRRARLGIAALLRAELFREGIDGEAVEWACARLRQRAARRRLLLVISDGCPMDSATGQANDAFYLDNHLKQVLAREDARREAQDHVEIMGLGVGLDLSPYYRRCLGFDAQRKLDSHLLAEIVQLMAGRRRR